MAVRRRWKKMAKLKGWIGIILVTLFIEVSHLDEQTNLRVSNKYLVFIYKYYLF